MHFSKNLIIDSVEYIFQIFIIIAYNKKILPEWSVLLNENLGVLKKKKLLFYFKICRYKLVMFIEKESVKPTL